MKLTWPSALLVVLIAVAVGAIVVKATGVGRGPHGLSAADEKKLAALQDQFRQERGLFLRMRDAGDPDEKVKAQEAKAGKVADQVMALGGVSAMQEIGRAPEMRARGGGGAMGRGGGRMGRGARPPGSGAPESSRAPGRGTPDVKPGADAKAAR